LDLCLAIHHSSDPAASKRARPDALNRAVVAAIVGHEAGNVEPEHGAIVEGSALEIDEEELKTGEQWTPVNFRQRPPERG
jgi:hypothetical protein